MYWGITCPLYGISLFLPSIIKDLGYTSSTAQLLTVCVISGCYWTGNLLASLGTDLVGPDLYNRSNSCCACSLAFRSPEATIAFHPVLHGNDRHWVHYLPCIKWTCSSGCCVLRSIRGSYRWVLFLDIGSTSLEIMYFHCVSQGGKLTIPNTGIYPAFPGNVTWISVNLAGDYKRAAGMAIYIGLGNLAGGESQRIPHRIVALIGIKATILTTR